MCSRKCSVVVSATPCHATVGVPPPPRAVRFQYKMFFPVGAKSDGLHISASFSSSIIPGRIVKPAYPVLLFLSNVCVIWTCTSCDQFEKLFIEAHYKKSMPIFQVCIGNASEV